MLEDLKKLVTGLIPIVLDTAKVNKVNGETCEVQSLTNNAKYFKCSLNAIRENGENKVLLTPKIGSTVIIGILAEQHKSHAVIVQVCDLEKVFLKIGETTLEIGTEGYKLNGENFGGIVKAPELQVQLDKMTARIDGIIEAINNGQPAAGASDGGAALHTSIKTGLLAMGETEDFGDIENETIKHGNGL